MIRLYQLSYSPWSERARWALDHHRVAHETVEHLPMLGEGALRIAARKPVGRVSVPLLVDGDRAIFDSFEIARYAEQVGLGEPLLPEASMAAIMRWNQIAEQVTGAGRSLVTARTLGDPETLVEALPPFIPARARGSLAPLAGLGARFLQYKYGYRGVTEPRARAAAREGLLEVREAIRGGRRHLIGDQLTYADIAAATALQFFKPVADLYVPLGPATRRTWFQPDIADEFADLVAWRDQLYAEHRR
jgi:glutathione S-transferase